MLLCRSRMWRAQVDRAAARLAAETAVALQHVLVTAISILSAPYGPVSCAASGASVHGASVQGMPILNMQSHRCLEVHSPHEK